MTDAFKLPPEVHHNWKFLALGPDKKIYIQVGAPCNVCEINPEVHGQIRRYNLDGSGMEIVARGVRNSVGFDFHPKTGELWFTDNGRDWAGEEGFEEELNRVPANMIGANFGFPYCHANGQPDPDFKKAESVQRCAAAGRHARRARGGARHAVLHRARCSRRTTAKRSWSPATARGTRPKGTATTS